MANNSGMVEAVARAIHKADCDGCDMAFEPLTYGPMAQAAMARLASADVRRWLDDDVLGPLRRKAAGDFKTPQHQGQRGCDWDAGLVAAWKAVEAALTAALAPQEGEHGD